MFCLTARKGRGPLLIFDGERFTDDGKAKWFRHLKDARAVAGHLMRYNASRLRGYVLRAENCGHGKLMRNPIPLLLTQLSSAKTAYDTVQRNPKKRFSNSQRRAIADADSLLEDFSGHRGREVLRVKEPSFKAGLVVGPINGLAYTTIRDGKTEHYLHEFADHARPLLVASSDARSLRIVGGRFRFTEAGIIDDPKPR